MTTTEDFAASLSNLLADVDPRRSIPSIKSAVAQRIRETDQDVDITGTDYFNHTFAPDLVLTWGAEVRRVYLRTTTNPRYLLDDLRSISDTRPIVMPLGEVATEDDDTVDPDEPGHPEAARTSADDLRRESARTRTLIAAPNTLSVLNEQRLDAPVLRVLSRALLQGGRGLVGRQRAHEVGVDFGGGFLGAQAANGPVTAKAIETAETVLDTEHANQVTRLLQAAWIGSGAPATSFPTASGALSALDADSLRFLLDLADVEDDAFWARIGQDLTLQRLSEVRHADAANENFQRLIRGALPRLRARGCRVVPTHKSQKDLGNEGPRWFVHQSNVALDHGAFRTYFVHASLRDTELPTVEEPPVPVTTLVERATAADIDIAELEMSAGRDRQLVYRADNGTDVKSDGLLDRLATVASKDARVRAVVAMSGNKPMRCDLTSGSATGRTAAKFFMVELLRVAVPLLRPLTSRERDELNAVLTVTEARAATGDARLLSTSQLALEAGGDLAGGT